MHRPPPRLVAPDCICKGEGWVHASDGALEPCPTCNEKWIRRSAANAARLALNTAHRSVVRVPAHGTRFPGSVPGACFAGPRFPWPPPLAPPAPSPVARLCSSASQLLWLAYAIPCRRFANILANADARLGADVTLLFLHRRGLAPPTPRRSPRALRFGSTSVLTGNRRECPLPPPGAAIPGRENGHRQPMTGMRPSCRSGRPSDEAVHRRKTIKRPRKHRTQPRSVP